MQYTRWDTNLRAYEYGVCSASLAIERLNEFLLCKYNVFGIVFIQQSDETALASFMYIDCFVLKLSIVCNWIWHTTARE